MVHCFSVVGCSTISPKRVSDGCTERKKIHYSPVWKERKWVLLIWRMSLVLIALNTTCSNSLWSNSVWLLMNSRRSSQFPTLSIVSVFSCGNKTFTHRPIEVPSFTYTIYFCKFVLVKMILNWYTAHSMYVNNNQSIQRYQCISTS